MPDRSNIQWEVVQLRDSGLMSQKAIAAAVEKFNIPSNTHIVRLTVNAADMPYIGGHASGPEIFVWVSVHLTIRSTWIWRVRRRQADDRTDNDSYHYACAGKHVARLNVRVFEKNVCPLINRPA